MTGGGTEKAVTTITISRFSDNNKAFLLISILVLLLTAFAISVAALVKVIMLENKDLTCEEARIEFSEKVEEVRGELDEFALNTTEYIEESKAMDQELLEKSKTLLRATGILEHEQSAMTYSAALQFCPTVTGYRLCSYDELFIEPGVFYKDPYPGREWVPIRDTYNDWAQVGSAEDRTQTFQERNGKEPGWGESPTTGTLKKRIFCCLIF